MSSWGRGLLQSDDDYKIAEELGAMFGCDILTFSESQRAVIVNKMETDGLLSRKLEKILSPQYVPPLSYLSRSRMAVLLVILAMRLGARVDAEYMNLMHTRAPRLRNMFEQLQFMTALDEYKNNGTPWIMGSKNRKETEKAKKVGRTAYDAGDEFFYSGLGHSADEKPSSHTYSKNCWSCRTDEGELQRCARCNMARYVFRKHPQAMQVKFFAVSNTTGSYCSKACQKYDWHTHRTFCEPLEPRSVVSSRSPDQHR
ncbi:hypothetical protein PG993_006812 [Apiospora rasikravindrae]|uniref:MYND-type domain-containing protein n=1 Tax=Apiospora rasikravindrae TaxID=990691 RepID=A0ABR1T8Y9_9PEZI